MDETQEREKAPRQPGEPSNNKPAPAELPADPGARKASKSTQPAKE